MTFIILGRGLLANAIGNKRIRMLSKYLLELNHRVILVIPDFDPVFKDLEHEGRMVVRVKTKKSRFLSKITPFLKALGRLRDNLGTSETENRLPAKRTNGLRVLVGKYVARRRYEQHHCGKIFFGNGTVYRFGYRSFVKAITNNIEIVQAMEDEECVLITSVSPGYMNIVGKILKQAFPKVYWIADYRDPIEDNHYAKGFSDSRKLDICDRAAFKYSDLITGVSQGLIDKLSRTAQKKGMKIDHKLMILYNGYEIVESSSLNQEPKERLDIVYTGTVYRQQNLDLFLDAFSIEEVQKYFSFTLAGRIDSATRKRLNESSYDITFRNLGIVDYNESLRLQQQADLLLLLKGDDCEKGILTGKFFEYLSTGKPIIVIGNKDREFNEIASSMGGIFVLPYNSKAISEFLCDMAKAWPTEITRNAEESARFEWRNLTRNLIQEVRRRKMC